MYRYNKDENHVIDGDKQFIESTITKIFKFFLGGGLFKVFAFMFMLFGGMFWLKEYMIAKDYIKTIGTFEGYTSCSDGVCGNRYSYEVDGKTYYVSSDLSSDSFPETDDVYYNPENPAEAIMYSDWHIIFIVGLVLFVGIELFNRKMKSIIFGGNKKGPINV